ncbi:hypothetical protein [Oceanimonas baumannii]|uniref:DsrE/DsrF/DsrH-like protein n=1 Tax=Oceanimonas baumannii TaxID=129578 RepID=A0A235C9W7_9GAMM|nr:hypothetical protein [Oceanimonas baumannii]OYD21431.1 hypothetical protein B6S09_16035 [Oceanimonas baumannii]TDW56345.1 DsrE/DsrF/DsrH-like protein [Oceanimonas baumannii]
MAKGKNTLAALTLGAGITAAGAAQAAESKVLLLVTSAAPQVQGMAMVLGNAMQQQGSEVNVLLCDKAGDLAINGYSSALLKPKNVTPEQLMGKLQQGGGKVSVCALYLPNSEYTQADLHEQVEVATPANMAAMMTADDVRVFSF